MRNLRLPRPTLISCKPDRVWQDSTLLSASILVGGGLNYLYQVSLGRLLSPEVYGTFGALLGLFYLLWIFNQSIQLQLARSTAQGLTRPIGMFRSIALWGLGIGFVVSVLSPPLAQGLQLHSPLWILWLIFIWFLCTPLPAVKGVLQGRQQFARLAALNVIEPAIKLFVGIGLVWIGLGLWGAWGAWAVGAVLSFLFALQGWQTTPSVEVPARVGTGIYNSETGPALLAAFILAVPTNLDVLIVKASFSAHEAGLYTAAAILSKGFLFLTLGVSATLLPKAAASRQGEGRAHLAKAFKIAGSLNGIGALICILAPALLVRLLYGEGYLQSAPLVQFYGLVMLTFTGVALLANYALARGRNRLLVGLATLSVLEVGALAVGASSPLQVILMLLVFHAIMLGLGMFSLWKETPHAASLRPLGILMVAPYPPPKIKHGSAGGVASYTRNLTEALSRSLGMPLAVLANRLPDLLESEPHVLRCWSPNLRYIWHIWREVRRQRPALVHLQHEIFLFGSALSALSFPLLLLLLRPYARIVVTLHGVLPLSKLNQSFLRENGLQGRPALLRLGLYLLIRAIVSLSHRVIVHEESLKRYLVEEYRCRPEVITIIPHGIEIRTSDEDLPSSEDAKQVLELCGKRVILFLGYLTGYKGIELLLDGFAKVASAHPDWVLAIAGGPHPRRRDDPSYKVYLQELETRVARLGPQARLLGFVPEEVLPQVFCAANLVVFPYRHLIAFSGPLALSICYDRPFLASEAFSDVVDARLLFPLDPAAIGSKIEEFFASAKLAEVAWQQAAAWRTARNWDRVAQMTLTLYQNLLSEEAVWQIEVHQEKRWNLG